MIELWGAAAAGVSFFLALLGTEAAKARAVAWNFIDRPTRQRHHRQATPLGGGSAMLLAVLLPAALAMALAAIWTSRGMPPWVPGIRQFFSGITYFLVAGFIALAVWVWRGIIRPTYIRMAPGVIQVLNYGYSKSKPTIRSYPMQPGTLAIFTRLRKRLILTLARGKNNDMLLFSRMRQPELKTERAWQAMLSTASTPPLSDEELVG